MEKSKSTESKKKSRSEIPNKLSMSFEKDSEIDIPSIKIISKEINKMRYLIRQREKILNLINKFISISEQYAIDIFNLTLDLKQSQNTFEGKVNAIFYEILINISNSMSKMLTNLSEKLKSKANNSKEEENNSKDFENKIIKLKNSLIDKIKTTENDKNLYLNECEKFEEYLINKETTNESNKNKKNKNNKNNKNKNNDSFEIIEIKTNNHKEVYERQNKYKKSKTVSNKVIQQILCIIIKEKEAIHKGIYDCLYNFLTQMNDYNQIQNNFCLEQTNNLNLPILQLNYDIEKKNFQSLLNLDYYNFKCLKNVQNPSFSETKINNENKNKYQNLDEDQLINIFREVKKNKIKISEFDEEKLKIVEKKYHIISIIKLILTDSKKYDKKLKNELINLLKTDIDSIIIFIKYLNNNRSILQYNFSKNAYNEMSELFTLIIEYFIKNNDLIGLRRIFLMSITYYIEENGSKKFLCNNIKKFQIFDDTFFWANYLAFSVQEELKLSDKVINNKDYEMNRRSLAIFASILNTVQNMLEFGIDVKFILNFIEKHVSKQYKLTDDNKKELKMFLKFKIGPDINNENNLNKENEQKNENNDDVEQNINIENEIEDQIHNEGEEERNVINVDN